MSWLNEMQYEMRYECKDGHTTIIERVADDDAYADCSCLECGEPAKYRGFNPIRLNLRGKVTYEQNGRKAYRIADGHGNVRHVSASKHNYMEKGEARPGYTPEYERALRAGGRSDLLEVKSHETLVRERKAALKARVERASDANTTTKEA